MALSSLIFLWTLLPVTIVLLAVTRRMRNIQNILLLLLSLLFYAWGDPSHVLLLLISIAANYALGLAMGDGIPGGAAGAGSGRRKAVLVLAAALNLGILGFYKYSNFVLNSLDLIVPGDLPRTAVTLPVGVSFFTFSALTYLIDLYRGRVRAQRDPLRLALYISFFPRILSGPIETYEHFEKQLVLRADDSCMTYDTFACGLRRFLYGLGKKVLLADMMGITVSRIFALDSAKLSGAGAWIGMILYTLQLYYDFAGYSDMAIGLAKICGFTIPENFDYPYLSRSVTEFWRRWHATLGAWFREYLYIPLGGNRKGKKRTAVNLLIVFALTGLWHGASWQFVLWGLYQGIFVVLERVVPMGHRMTTNRKTGAPERLTLGRALEDSKWVGHIWAPLLWCISLVLFRSETFAEAASIYRHMFVPTLFLNAGTFLPQMFTLQTFLATVGAILGSGVLVSIFRMPRLKTAADRWKGSLPEAIYLAAVLILSVLSLAGGTFQAFIYQRF